MTGNAEAYFIAFHNERFFGDEGVDDAEAGARKIDG